MLGWLVTGLVFAGGGGFADYYTYGGQFSQMIPEYGAMPCACVQVDTHHIITDLDIGLTITHSNVFDLQVELESPAGTRLQLVNYDPYYEYFEGADYTRTIFDDEAAFDIKHGQAPFTGRFRPQSGSELSIFDGEDAFGTWKLHVIDKFPLDSGSLDNFQLYITNPEPATILLMITAFPLLRKRPPPKP